MIERFGPVHSRRFAWRMNTAAYLTNPLLVGTFRRKLGYWPNVAFPVSLQEKFLWRKIFDRNPLFAVASDKLLSKRYAAGLCPGINIPRVIWQGASLAAAPKHLFGAQTVLKANHGSGYNQFLPMEGLDQRELQIRTDRWLATRYGKYKGEWAYGRVEPTLFFEERLQGSASDPLVEYKVHVSSGKVIWAFGIQDRFGADRSATCFRPDGTCYDVPDSRHFKMRQTAPGRGFEEALALAERLGAEFDYVRCDFMVAAGAVWFGELTMYPSSGYPDVTGDTILDDWNNGWDLSRSWFFGAAKEADYAKALRASLDARRD